MSEVCLKMIVIGSILLFLSGVGMWVLAIWLTSWQWGASAALAWLLGSLGLVSASAIDSM